MNQLLWFSSLKITIPVVSPIKMNRAKTQARLHFGELPTVQVSIMQCLVYKTGKTNTSAHYSRTLYLILVSVCFLKVLESGEKKTYVTLAQGYFLIFLLYALNNQTLAMTMVGGLSSCEL